MGRYISTGIVYMYAFNKAKVEKEYSSKFGKTPFSKIKPLIIDQLFPELYEQYENDEHFFLSLSKSIRGEDIASLMKAYFSLVGDKEDIFDTMEKLAEAMKGLNADQVYLFAGEVTEPFFSQVNLGTSYPTYMIPLVVNGKRHFFTASLLLIKIDNASSKTDTEDDIESYDFFTDLLRYRMKPEKLADSMIIYLSQ